LDEPVHTYVADRGHREIGKNMTCLYGPKAHKITFMHLLTMRSGIGPKGVPLHKVLDNPLSEAMLLDQEKSPVMILNYGKLLDEPGNATRYIEDNHIILGLALAALSNKTRWWEYDQRDVFPHELRAAFPKTKFCKFSKYRDNTGFNVKLQMEHPHDLGGVRCMAAWTAGNLFTTTVEAARFAQELFSPQGRILRPHTRELYFTTPSTAWGFGNLGYGASVMANLPGSAIGGTYEGLESGLGHIGIIIGAMSIVAYLPNADTSISVTVGDLRLSSLRLNMTNVTPGSNLTIRTVNSTRNTSKVVFPSKAGGEEKPRSASEFHGPASEDLELMSTSASQRGIWSSLNALSRKHKKKGWRKLGEQNALSAAGKQWQNERDSENLEWEDTLQTWVSPSPDDFNNYIKFQAANAIEIIKVILKGTIL